MGTGLWTVEYTLKCILSNKDKKLSLLEHKYPLSTVQSLACTVVRKLIGIGVH